MSRALVLSGGGVTGIAWELGVIAGLATEGVDVTPEADLILGTSAGAAVAAEVTSGEPLDALVARQRSEESKEIAAVLDLDVLGSIFAILWDDELEPDERRARAGAAALAAETVSEAVRLETIAARLPNATWPDAEEHRRGAHGRRRRVGRVHDLRRVLGCAPGRRRGRELRGPGHLAAGVHR